MIFMNTDERKEFLKKYDSMKTIGDITELLEPMSIEDLGEFIDHHNYVEQTTRLDMRQEFTLSHAKYYLEKKLLKHQKTIMNIKQELGHGDPL